MPGGGIPMGAPRPGGIPIGGPIGGLMPGGGPIIPAERADHRVNVTHHAPGCVFVIQPCDSELSVILLPHKQTRHRLQKNTAVITAVESAQLSDTP